MKKIIDEFKKFAFKGNIVDMAIGIIIGTAFTAIINSLVGDILMPLISTATAGIHYEDLKIILQNAVYNEAGEIITPEVVILYGKFIQNIIYFLIVAISCFIAIKLINNSSNKAKHHTNKIMNKIKPKKNEPEPEPEPEAPKPPTQEELLTEIRDLLKANNNNINK